MNDPFDLLRDQLETTPRRARRDAFATGAAAGARRAGGAR